MSARRHYNVTMRGQNDPTTLQARVEELVKTWGKATIIDKDESNLSEIQHHCMNECLSRIEYNSEENSWTVHYPVWSILPDEAEAGFKHVVEYLITVEDEDLQNWFDRDTKCQEFSLAYIKESYQNEEAALVAYAKEQMITRRSLYDQILNPPKRKTKQKERIDDTVLPRFVLKMRKDPKIQNKQFLVAANQRAIEFMSKSNDLLAMIESNERPNLLALTVDEELYFLETRVFRKGTYLRISALKLSNHVRDRQGEQSAATSLIYLKRVLSKTRKSLKAIANSARITCIPYDNGFFWTSKKLTICSDNFNQADPQYENTLCRYVCNKLEHAERVFAIAVQIEHDKPAKGIEWRGINGRPTIIDSPQELPYVHYKDTDLEVALAFDLDVKEAHDGAIWRNFVPEQIIALLDVQIADLHPGMNKDVFIQCLVKSLQAISIHIRKHITGFVQGLLDKQNREHSKKLKSAQALIQSPSDTNIARACRNLQKIVRPGRRSSFLSDYIKILSLTDNGTYLVKLSATPPAGYREYIPDVSPDKLIVDGLIFVPCWHQSTIIARVDLGDCFKDSFRREENRKRGKSQIEEIRVKPLSNDPYPNLFTPRSEIDIPVLHEGKLYAVLSFESEDAGAYGPEEAIVLETFASMLGAVLAEQQNIRDTQSLNLAAKVFDFNSAHNYNKITSGISRRAETAQCSYREIQNLICHSSLEGDKLMEISYAAQSIKVTADHICIWMKFLSDIAEFSAYRFLPNHRRPVMLGDLVGNALALSEYARFLLSKPKNGDDIEYANCSWVAEESEPDVYVLVPGGVLAYCAIMEILTNISINSFRHGKVDEVSIRIRTEETNDGAVRVSVVTNQEMSEKELETSRLLRLISNWGELSVAPGLGLKDVLLTAGILQGYDYAEVQRVLLHRSINGEILSGGGIEKLPTKLPPIELRVEGNRLAWTLYLEKVEPFVKLRASEVKEWLASKSYARSPLSLCVCSVSREEISNHRFVLPWVLVLNCLDCKEYLDALIGFWRENFADKRVVFRLDFESGALEHVRHRFAAVEGVCFEDELLEEESCSYGNNTIVIFHDESRIQSTINCFAKEKISKGVHDLKLLRKLNVRNSVFERAIWAAFSVWTKVVIFDDNLSLSSERRRILSNKHVLLKREFLVDQWVESVETADVVVMHQAVFSRWSAAKIDRMIQKLLDKGVQQCFVVSGTRKEEDLKGIAERVKYLARRVLERAMYESDSKLEFMQTIGL